MSFSMFCCLQFLDFVKISFLKRLSANLPRSLLSLDSNWPAAPPALEEVMARPSSIKHVTLSTNDVKLLICLTTDLSSPERLLSYPLGKEVHAWFNPREEEPGKSVAAQLLSTCNKGTTVLLCCMEGQNSCRVARTTLNCYLAFCSYPTQTTHVLDRDWITSVPVGCFLVSFC